MGTRVIRLLAAAITVFAVAPAFSQEAVNATTARLTSDSITQKQRANPQRTIDLLTAPIKSQADLDAYLQQTPMAVSPLRFLSPSNRQLFLAGLGFGNYGLGGLHYTDLEGLTATQAYEILHLFGWQSTVQLIDGLRAVTSLDKLIISTGSASPLECFRGYMITTAYPHSCYVDQNYLCCPD
jgi:hypothetical protein